MTLVEYYKSRYNLVIKDTKQPLILSMPKAADRRAGQDGPILLVPELCNMTGLSDDQRANFKLMKVIIYPYFFVQFLKLSIYLIFISAVIWDMAIEK